MPRRRWPQSLICSTFFQREIPRLLVITESRVRRRTTPCARDAGQSHRAADAAFGFVCHATGACEPVVRVVVGVDETRAVFVGKADLLLLAQFIFVDWMNVGGLEEDRALDAGLHEGFHQLARARRAAPCTNKRSPCGSAKAGREALVGMWCPSVGMTPPPRLRRGRCTRHLCSACKLARVRCPQCART